MPENETKKQRKTIPVFFLNIDKRDGICDVNYGNCLHFQAADPEAIRHKANYWLRKERLNPLHYELYIGEENFPAFQKRRLEHARA